jgi:hypothetical protein
LYTFYYCHILIAHPETREMPQVHNTLWCKAEQPVGADAFSLRHGARLIFEEQASDARGDQGANPTGVWPML